MCLVVINSRVAAECSATTKGAFCRFIHTPITPAPVCGIMSAEIIRLQD